VRRRAGLAIAMAIALGAATAGCSDGGSDPAAQPGFVAGDPASTFVEVAERKPAPDLTGPLLGGGTYSLATARGDDIVVVNVWGSWCGPCRSEAAALEEVYQEVKDKGVQFLGINTRDQEAQALAFVVNKGITYPSLVDDGAMQAGFASSLPVAGIPTTFVIDRSGGVAARAVSEVSYTRLLELVEAVLAEDETTGLG
ncbi:MAG: TlpA family protein disulfide reductase, partial [Actinomycetota bacterium]|nr:TlpA family protein disulfide reductase [Actinomycetota bacterium]